MFSGGASSGPPSPARGAGGGLGLARMRCARSLLCSRPLPALAEHQSCCEYREMPPIQGRVARSLVEEVSHLLDAEPFLHHRSNRYRAQWSWLRERINSIGKRTDSGGWSSRDGILVGLPEGLQQQSAELQADNTNGAS